MAIEALAVRKEEVIFVAFAGWNAAGAKAFGYPTFWVNRLNSSPNGWVFFLMEPEKTWITSLAS